MRDGHDDSIILADVLVGDAVRLTNCGACRGGYRGTVGGLELLDRQCMHIRLTDGLEAPAKVLLLLLFDSFLQLGAAGRDEQISKKDTET